MIDPLIIVGGGQAACSCGFKLRELGYKGPILMVSAEDSLPYHRPPLSKKYLPGDIERNSLLIKPASLYQDDQIEVKLGTFVTRIDRSLRHIVLDTGEVLPYQTLVLATGARARKLPSDQGGEGSNVFTLRTLDDADKLRPHMQPEQSLLIVGGGYIGLEMAAVARKLGLKVTLIELSERLLNRVASAETAAYFKSLHESHEVEICEKTGIESVSRAGDKVVSVTLTSGKQLNVDLVIVGIGVEVNNGIAKEAGLTTGLGIEVDETGRTSDPCIYAVGDCASFKFRGQTVRIESIQNAVDQAEAVARSIVDPCARYQPYPWFWSDQYDTKLQTAGLNIGYTKVVYRKSKKRSDAASIWYFDDHRLLAVDAINEPATFMIAKSLLKAGGDLDPDHLESVDNLRTLLKV